MTSQAGQGCMSRWAAHPSIVCSHHHAPESSLPSGGGSRPAWWLRCAVEGFHPKRRAMSVAVSRRGKDADPRVRSRRSCVGVIPSVRATAGSGSPAVHLSYAEMTAASSLWRLRRGGQPSSASVTTSGRTPDSAAIEPSGTPVVRARAQAASTAVGCRVGSCTDRVSSGREGRCGRRVDLTAAHRVPPKGRSVP